MLYWLATHDVSPKWYLLSEIKRAQNKRACWQLHSLLPPIKRLYKPESPSPQRNKKTLFLVAFRYTLFRRLWVQNWTYLYQKRQWRKPSPRFNLRKRQDLTVDTLLHCHERHSPHVCKASRTAFANLVAQSETHCRLCCGLFFLHYSANQWRERQGEAEHEAKDEPGRAIAELGAADRGKKRKGGTETPRERFPWIDRNFIRAMNGGAA
ncbi:hypothetical protein NDU88_002794 [Pleurodeles waltl]|uniref:Uncharacterized protein n=1 Tax=Pleurodeles waltl TaxID=8319 RepID=A0AAV7UDE2_PLEWA|nr:hypothetical protein NDU88_002794 [Pleurodeles waltl]